jgi:amidohydrolase
MDAKTAARAEIDASREQLVDLSHRIHAHPELNFEEHQSSRWVADELERGGFTVDYGVCDLPTAFLATIGSGPLHVGICAEYDALPDIGHACGHNIIAAAAAGAGLGLARVADDVGLTVTVLGTPAEEGGGGKIFMLERGGFAGIHAAMMVHPSSTEMDRMGCLAVSHVDVHYHGKAAHASAWPEMGINAADAITVAQTAIGLLRQHIRQSDRIHGIVLKGGEAPNIVPSHTVGRWLVRARTVSELADLEPRVRACFDAGALATGCRVEVIPTSPVYSEMKTDEEMAGIYRANAESIGRIFPDIPAAVRERTAGSTDMANVSLEIPTIHPMLGLDCFPAVNHQPEFTAACATAVADQAVGDGAVGMAWTAIDLAAIPAVRERLLSGVG